MRRTLFFLVAAVCQVCPLVYTPRIQINNQVDFYSLETMVAGVVTTKMSPREKAEAIWRFSMSNMFHYKSPDEGLPDNAVKFEMNTVVDPLKLLNVYGYAYCFSYISLTSKLWALAGLDSTRIWGIHGHLLSEVYYDGGWHYYDADQSVSAFFLKEDGKTVASVDEVQNNPEKYLIRPKFKSIPNMPYDSCPAYLHESRKELGAMFGSKEDNYIRDRYGVTLHQMDYALRKNESLTLFFGPQGRWRHNGMDNSSMDPARGPHDAHGTRTYANGLFEYRPDFKDAALPDEGFYSSDNIRCTGKLELKDASQSGEFIVKVSSPYIITGTPLTPSNDFNGATPYSGAAVVAGHVDSKNHSPTAMEMPDVDLELLIATDNAFGEFTSVYRQKKAGYFTVDLSEYLSSPVYYYHLKVVLKKAAGKKAEDPFIDSMALKTWVQVNPASLPKLEPGANRISYSAEGPAVGKVDIERCYNTPKAMEFLYASSNTALSGHGSKKYIQGDTTKPAWLIFEMNAPEGEVRDFYASALFHMREGTKSALFYSENDTVHWKKVSQPPKLHHEHWADWLTPAVTASPGVRRVYFKIALEGGASLSLFNYGYRHHSRPATGRVEVVQGAEIDGKFREFRWPFEGSKGEKRLKVGGKRVVNRFLRFEGR